MFILRGSHPRVGGKARALAVAAAAGIRVPEWFVVSPDAFAKAHTAVDRKRLAADVADALCGLCPNGQPVAVRSSAMDEDGAAHTFAGQLESFLSVPHSEVMDRISRVWQSGFHERVRQYRRKHGLPPVLPPPAVVVQRMVTADTAGVAFSADPVTGRRNVAVVAAVRGLADGLVSGLVNGDTYHVDRSGAIGLRVLAEGGADSALADPQVREVADLARRAAHVFGCPQDIEWAFEAGRLNLLQSRPITSLPDEPAVEGVHRIWDNSNIIESYSGVTSPLTFSFAREAYEGVYRQFCRLMRVPEARMAANDDLFGNMLGLIRGRVYYNLLNWYRLLALLPGYAVNRRFMEQMMGVKQPLGSDPGRRIADTSDPTVRLRTPGSDPGRQITHIERLRDGVRLVGMVAALALNLVTLRKRQARFRARLDAALAPPDPPLADQSADEIAAYYRRLRSQLLTEWDAPLLNDFFAMIFYGALRDLVVRWCDDTHGTLQNDLLAHEGGMISAEPVRAVQSLAALAAPHDRFVDLLLCGAADEIAAAARQIPAFPRECDAYLQQFGERCADELKLESATLLDNPLPLFRAIGHLARQHRNGQAPIVRADATNLRAHAEQRVRTALGSHPFRRCVFQWVLSNARGRVRDRENLRFERTRLFGRIRRIFLELGRRFHDARVLDDPRDIFYLEVDEILGFVEGRTVTTNLASLVALRRAEFQAHAEGPAPDSRFETRGMVHGANAFRTSASDRRDDDGAVEHKGVGCCPGVLRGPVCVVLDPASAALSPGSILVAERTDPGWIMIFPSAAGIIVERGSMLSHSAIVARELGIPAIVSVPGATTWLKDGDWVEMDGSTGIVRKVAA
jgi:phosphohistidine swiveling domain-containing protein